MIRNLFLWLAIPVSCWATAYTSNGTGNWNVSGTWSPAAVPGNGDTATIRDGDVVTCPTSITCIIGTNAGATALTIGQGFASTAKLINNGTFIARGNIVSNPLSSVRTPSYCALTLGAASTFTWDSSLTSPTSTTYTFNSASGNQQDAVLCANGTSNAGDSTGITTGGNHVTINSNAGGGNGYFTTGFQSALAHVITYADFTRCGDSANKCITVSGTSGVQLLSIDHSTFTSGGGVYVGNTQLATNWAITHNVWSDTKDSHESCMTWASPPGVNGSTSKTMTSNSCDVLFGDPATGASFEGISYSTNMGDYSAPSIVPQWVSFTNNLVRFTFASNPSGGERTGQGSMDGVYWLYDADIGHKHWMAPTGHAAATYAHMIFDSDVTANYPGSSTPPCPGSDIVLTGNGSDTVGQNFPISYVIVVPPAEKGCSPGGILQPLNDAPTNATLSLDHSTIFSAQEALNLADVPPVGYTAQVAYAVSNLFYAPPGYPPGSAGAAFKSNDLPQSCIQDLVPPSLADYNASWGIANTIPGGGPICFHAHSRAGWWGNFSADPGVHDLVNADPQFVDITRNLATFDTAYLGHAVGTPWSSGSSYTVGQIVSHPVSSFYNSSVVNFVNIQAYSPGSAPCDSDAAQQCSEPGGSTVATTNNGANWRQYWKLQSLSDITNGLYSGATFGGLDVIAALRKWVTDGFAPQNRDLCTSGANTSAVPDGSPRGAVPCVTALQVNGPDTCQQGQSCTYTATGGTPPYAFSLVSGSVGSTSSTSNPATVSYTSPNHVVPQQQFNGCMGMPSNSVFNTRVDGTVPVATNSTLWLTNTAGAGGNYGNGAFGTGQRLNGNVVLSTDQAVGMTFNYSPNPGVVVDSYKIQNGTGHTYLNLDKPYAPPSTWAVWGDPTVGNSVLTLGKGYLTDGVLGAANPIADVSVTPKAVTGGSWNSGTFNSTLTVTDTTGLNVGDYITVSGTVGSIAPDGYNGPHQQIISLVANTSVTYFYASSNSGTATGGTIQKDLVEGLQTPNWIGWAIIPASNYCAGSCPDDVSDTFATFTEHFALASAVQSVKFYVTNFNGLGIGVFGAVTVDFSNDGVAFGGAVTYTSTGGDRAYGARYVTVPIGQTNAYSYMRVRMTHQNYTPGSGVCTGSCVNFILLSEATPIGYGTPMVFNPFPNGISQAGAAWTAPGDFSEPDDHFLTTYRDTCQQAETYKYYSLGVYTGIFGQDTNSASGTVYPLLSNRLTGVGTDAAQLPLAPLIYHQDEVLAAAQGNLDAIKHATRITFSVSNIDTGTHVWPAQADNGYLSTCSARDIIGNGTTSIAPVGGQLFMTTWPSPLTVTIDGTPATVTIIDATHATASILVSGSGNPHAMAQPHTSCMPYGTRMRLKSSYTWTPPGTCDTACQNITNAVIRQQQRYGVLLADIGSLFEGDGDFGSILGYSLNQAVTSLAIQSSPANYEVVDESTLETSQRYNATDITWAEAKLGNGYVTPANAAVVKVIDSAGAPASAYYSVALQGVVIGVEHPNEVVMAGASPFQLNPWVTGSTNTSFTCSLSPSGSGGGTNYGTITSGCLYTPPASGLVTHSSITQTTVTVTSSADNTVTKTIAIQIIPLSSDGNLHISTGKAYDLGSGINYTDTNGIVWWNDMVQGLVPALQVDDFGNSQTGTWSDYPGSHYVAQSPGLFGWFLYGINDHHFRIHVSNGTVTGIALNTNRTSGTNQAGFSFDCNGTIGIVNTDIYSYTAGQYVNRPMSCTAAVSDSVLHMVVRPQGPTLGSTQTGIACLSPCYDTGNATSYNFVPGIVVIPGALPPGASIDASGHVIVGGKLYMRAN